MKDNIILFICCSLAIWAAYSLPEIIGTATEISEKITSIYNNFL